MDGQALAMPAAMDEPHDDPRARVAALFDAHHQRVFRLATRLAGNAEDARDLVQDTFLRAARSPGAIPDGAASEEAWLVRILVNLCRDRWRHAAVHRRASDLGRLPHESSVDPEPTLIARSMVRHALQALPARRRAILVLYELEGCSIAAIAAMLRVTPVTVRWHLSVARRQMARTLGEPR
jgi:RNA polymerase sigma-70 factor (ECF subfamily)